MVISKHFLYVFPKIEVPQNGWFIINGKPPKKKSMDLGAPFHPYFWVDTHIKDLVHHHPIDSQPLTYLANG